VAPPDERDNRSATARRAAGRYVRGSGTTLEAYLRASTPPRYMLRIREIEMEYRALVARLREAYEALKDAFEGDAARFAEVWRREARAWPFESLNDIVREHNEWYPVESGLPMDPRTRDYVLLHGASYRRLELGPDWVLAHFPPEGDAEPSPPRRAPREPT
jgi:hypothetical protein